MSHRAIRLRPSQTPAVHRCEIPDKTFVMLAGSSIVVTDPDGWMLRDVWRHVRKKYGYPAP